MYLLVQTLMCVGCVATRGIVVGYSSEIFQSGETDFYIEKYAA